MNKNILLLSLFLSVFISCSKSSRFGTVDTNKSIHEILDNFKDISTQNEQKIAFSLLTNAERVILAKDHINFCISYFNLNNTQVFILEQIKLKLNSMINDTIPETNLDVLWMEEQINLHFTSLDTEELTLIFSSMVCSVEDLDEWMAPGPVGGGGAGVDCNCSVASNYCTGITGGGGSWIPCKTKTNCKDSSWGCGSLLLYACKGICSIFG